MDISGIGSERVQLRWVSSAEGKLFADYVTEVSKITRDLGPFDQKKFKLPLNAVERTLNSVRMRWLMGLTRQLTEQGNVYHEKLDKKDFKTLLQQITEEEYHKAMIVEALREGPLSVKEMAKKIGLSIYSVSLSLNELERCGQVELSGYEGRTPKFNNLAA